MSTLEMRQALHKRIDQIDEKFLKAVYAMVAAYLDEEDPIVGYEVDGKPIYASALREELDKEVENVVNGDYISAEELDKKSRTWLQSTK